MKTKITLLLLFLFLFKISFSQTCIVAVWSKTKDTLWIGADSRAARESYHTQNKTSTWVYTDTACKIVSNPKIGMAYSGYNGNECMKLAREVLQNVNNIDSFGKLFTFSAGRLIIDS